jgi:hypothetical protein
MADTLFYVSIAGRTIGPVTEQQVLDGIRARKVPGDADICRVGDSEWRYVREVEPFAREFAPAALAPPPPPRPTTQEPVGVSTTATTPKVWNPQAAAAWMFLFGPVFGSVLLGLNWRELGFRERAMRAWAWTAVTLAVWFAGAIVSTAAPGAARGLPCVFFLLVLVVNFVEAVP